ncbi:MAG: UvrD-helicase domain-containing protein, partial [Planctomycetaceae bacterium]
MSFHRITKAKDPNFWSARVSRDIRIIVHKTDASLLLCYVDHHDDAYDWAQRRKIEQHPVTGAAQLVEIRETFKEVIMPNYVDSAPAPVTKPKLFAQTPADDLLTYGVPPEWLADVLEATEDNLFELSEHLPTEAAEALLDLATGTKPVTANAGDADPFAHPDAQRRFRLVSNVEELERALDFPWEKWTVFLHPAQRRLVERSFNGPARISGSAGTGKTIVALHRAVYLARQNPKCHVLLSTFSPALAMALAVRMNQLVGNEPKVADRIHVSTISDVAGELFSKLNSGKSIAAPEAIRSMLQKASAEVDAHRFTDRFLWVEWHDIIDAWNIASWDEYRDVQRLGRKTRLRKEQRETAWQIFEKVVDELKRRNTVTAAGLLYECRSALASSNDLSEYEFAVIDEAQDISIPELCFVAALGTSRPDSLFFSGDLGQRIFQTPFSWKSLGVDIRGRSHTLRINYRTSQQIRSQADKLLPPELSDVDGVAENRKGTISVFEGPAPEIRECEDTSSETVEVANWLKARATEGFQPR